MDSLNVWFINRQGQIVDEPVIVTEYEMNKDYISPDLSEFFLTKEVNFSKGDFIIAKFESWKNETFIGVVDGRENNKVVVSDLYSLIDFEFPATRFSGNSFEGHMRNLINRYLLQDSTKLVSILDIDVLTNTSHLYRPKEPPTATNLSKYLINGFKKYNVVWDIQDFNGRIKSVLVNRTDRFDFKTDLYAISNLEISTVEVGKNIDNHLMIVNKNTTNSEGPNVLAEYYLTTDNELTTNINHPKIFRPTKTKIWIYDTTEQDKPSYLEVAQSELTGNFYSHEISFDIDKKSELFQMKDLKIGILTNIYHKDSVYQSVLTGYSMKSGTDLITLRFGHIRSRLSEILE